MTDKARARRLADRIREIVAAHLVERGIKDPRLGFLTITEVRVTADLREATLYYTVFGDDSARRDSAIALESAKGVLRSEVGRQIGIRHTPSLVFVSDEVPETARQLDDLLARARAADEEVAHLAEKAVPAGDPDPYKKPRELDTDDDDDAEDEDADELAVDAADHLALDSIESSTDAAGHARDSESA